MPRALLVNPWIHDFAAHDFWARPRGLLELGAKLSAIGYRLDFIDALSLDYPGRTAPWPYRRQNGSGKFDAAIIEKPAALAHVPRRYKRYGMPPEAFRRRLAGLAPPDVVLMSSGMTYWYPGVRETVAEVKRAFPAAPVVLGGVYATLLPEHAAANTGADHVAAGPGDRALPPLLERLGLPHRLEGGFAFPAWDLYSSLPAAAVVTSRGCGMRCPYCGVRSINPVLERRDPAAAADEIERLSREQGTLDVALFDDAIRAGGDDHFAAFLEAVIRRGSPVRLHAINAIHARGLSGELARLMRRARLETVRLGIETTDPGRAFALGGKAGLEDLAEARRSLGGAGYAPAETGAYLLAGLPGQRRAELEQSIDDALRLGARPYLAEFSPVPGSPIWPEALRGARYDLAEPLFHNNTLLPCAHPEFDAATILRLKQRAREPFRPARPS